MFLVGSRTTLAKIENVLGGTAALRCLSMPGGRTLFGPKDSSPTTLLAFPARPQSTAVASLKSTVEQRGKGHG